MGKEGRRSTSASRKGRIAIPWFSVPGPHATPLFVRSRSSDDRRSKLKAWRHERPATLLARSGVAAALGRDIPVVANGRALTQMDDEGFVRIVPRASDHLGGSFGIDVVVGTCH